MYLYTFLSISLKKQYIFISQSSLILSSILFVLFKNIFFLNVEHAELCLNFTCPLMLCHLDNPWLISYFINSHHFLFIFRFDKLQLLSFFYAVCIDQVIFIPWRWLVVEGSGGAYTKIEVHHHHRSFLQRNNPTQQQNQHIIASSLSFE